MNRRDISDRIAKGLLWAYAGIGIAALILGVAVFTVAAIA